MSAEEALLGACLVTRAAAGIAEEEGIRPEDFFYERHGDIYRAVLSLSARGVMPDPVALAGELGEGADRAYLHGLVQLCPVATNAREYAREVKEEATKRRVRTLAQEILASSMSGEELLGYLEEQVFLAERPTRELMTLEDAFQGLYQELSEGKEPVVLHYPWDKVQWATRGMWPGWLCVLAGRPGHGKTAAAIEICDELVKVGNRRVLYVSLEMKAREIAVRMAQRYQVDPAVLFWERKADAADFSKLSTLAGRKQFRNITVADAASIGRVARLARRVKPDLLVLDHLQLTDTGKGSRYEGITRNSRDLKVLAGQLQIPVLCLSQLNREAAREKNRLPRLHDLRESGSIEQDADTVVFVWRREDDRGRLLNEGAFLVAKSRFNTTGNVEVSFDGAKQRFDDKR